MSEIIMGLDGAEAEDTQNAVTNALYSCSGVLDVNFSPGGGQIRVRYDSSNIYAEDLKDTIQQEGCTVSYVRE